VSSERAAGAAEQMPRVRVTRRQLIGVAVFVIAIVAFLYFVLPKLVGLGATWDRLTRGNVWWLALAFGLETLSYVGYVILFRGVFSRGAERIGWRASYEITMSSLVATRLFAAAGAGGIALAGWALRRAGIPRRLVACRMVAFLVLLYAVYMGALVVDGLGLYLGLWEGAHPFAITVLPAIFGAVVIVVFLLVSLLPSDFDRIVSRRLRSAEERGATGRLSGLLRRLAAAPTTMGSGIRTAIRLVAERNPSLVGALAWWGFDIATLWACFHAFGASPDKAVIVMAYFVGWLANALPLPGGVGAVEGGMIGAFSAFGVSVQTAIVAVLAYRAFSFWLPTLPGVVAYLQLRRTVGRWHREGLRAERTASRLS
jgi:uncharacterized protein (TIRG00374 family)